MYADPLSDAVRHNAVRNREYREHVAARCGKPQFRAAWIGSSSIDAARFREDEAIRDCPTNQSLEDNHVSVSVMADSETIINAVREFPCLWQVNSKSYKDQRARENAWKRVSSSISQCLCALRSGRVHREHTRDAV